MDNWHGDKDRAFSWVVSLRTVRCQTGQKFSMQFLITTSYFLAGELTAIAHLGLFARPTKTAILRAGYKFIFVCHSLQRWERQAWKYQARDSHENKLMVQRVLFKENPTFSPPLRNGMKRLIEISLSFYISFVRWPKSAFNTSDNAGKNLHVVSHFLQARKRHPKAPKYPGVGTSL